MPGDRNPAIFTRATDDLLDRLDETRPGSRPTDSELAWIRIERDDARNDVVLGDPAVRLRVEGIR